MARGWLLCLPCLCHASLLTLCISPRVVISISFQQVDNAPNAQARAKRDNKGLQYAYRRIKKRHKLTSLSAAFAAHMILFFVVEIEKPPLFSGGCGWFL